MLNLTSSDKTFSVCKCNHCRLDCLHVSAYVSILVQYCIGVSLSVRPVNQQGRQLAVRCYSRWYSTMSGVDVLARRFRFASNSYIVLESTNVKVCQYQVMISNGLFEETNEQRISSKVFIQLIAFCISCLTLHFNEKSFNEKFLLTRNIQ